MLKIRDRAPLSKVLGFYNMMALAIVPRLSSLIVRFCCFLQPNRQNCFDLERLLWQAEKPALIAGSVAKLASWIVFSSCVK